MKAIKFGVMHTIYNPTYTPKPRTNPHGTIYYKLREPTPTLVNSIALEAEKLGYDSIWVVDHLSTTAENQRYECWTTMTWIAALTKKIRIGSLVICPLYRHPAILAKMASTLDILSGGRLELGLGACSRMNKNEATPRGIKWYGPRTRIEILEETLNILKDLWTKEKVSFHGKHYRLEDVFCEPKPTQKPHPPVLIAGTGEKHTLRVVAKYADKSNFGFYPINEFKDRLDVLEKHCKDVGRDYDSIEKTAEIGVIIHSDRDEYLEAMRKRFMANVGIGSFKEWLKDAEDHFITGTPEDCVEKIQTYIDYGVYSFMIRFGDLPDFNGMQLFKKEVIPKLNR
jgi:F420-dependent oxidoreductase-like protein